MTQTLDSEYSREFFLTAAECDASGCMPMTLLIERLIDIATEHANSLHIGYADLLPHGIGWVLSRVAVQIVKPLPYNNHYKITTWIEDFNRRLSNRCFIITDKNGDVIAHARSLWVTINFATREAGNIEFLMERNLPLGTRQCPIRRFARIPQLPASAVRRHYTFRYCDIDVNRHVNTVRYIALILNSWSLEHFDNNAISTFDIAFHHECTFGMQVGIRILDIPDPENPSRIASSVCEIVKSSPETAPEDDEAAERALSVAIEWIPRS